MMVIQCPQRCRARDRHDVHDVRIPLRRYVVEGDSDGGSKR